MTETELDACIESGVRLLQLPIDPAWKASIRANLDVSLKLAALVSEFELPDAAEPAPAFAATDPK